MKPKAMRSYAILGAITALALPARGAEISTGPVDNLALQALVDAADPGDTLLLAGGVYDFFSVNAPVRIAKGVKIVAADQADPPVLLGDGTLGTPFGTGNNGFLVFALTEDLPGLEIDGLHLKGFDRAIAFGPAFDEFGCAIEDPGALSRVTVANNSFEDSRRGVQIFGGSVENYDFVDNEFLNIGQAAVVVVAGRVFDCTAAILFTDLPKGGTVARNSVSGGFSGITISTADNTVVKDNVLNGTVLGIGLANNRGPAAAPARLGVVSGNTLNNSFIGILLEGPSPIRSASVSNNAIASTFNVVLTSGANGFLVANNDFSGGTLVDVVLDGSPLAAHDNTLVATDFETTYFDQGIENHLVGTLAMVENPGVPPEVRQMLADLRGALGPP